MGVLDRYNKTGSMESAPTTNVSDGAGGYIPGDRTVINAAYTCNVFRMSPYREQQERNRLQGAGLVESDELWLGTGAYNAAIVTGCLYNVSASEKYRVLAAVPQFGQDAGEPSHLALTFVKNRI